LGFVDHGFVISVDPASLFCFGGGASPVDRVPALLPDIDRINSSTSSSSEYPTPRRASFLELGLKVGVGFLFEWPEFSTQTLCHTSLSALLVNAASKRWVVRFGPLVHNSPGYHRPRGRQRA